jgi:hypothetical protein
LRTSILPTVARWCALKRFCILDLIDFAILRSVLENLP